MNKQGHFFVLQEGAGGGEGGGGTGGGGTGGGGTGGGGTTTTTGGTGPADWKAGLAPEFNGHPALADIKDVNGLVKTYLHSQSLVGMDKLPIPKDANDPAWNDVWTRLGRPKDENGYELAYDEAKVPKELHNPKLVEGVKKLFLKHNIPAAAAKGIFADYNDLVVSTYQEQQAQITQQREQWVKQIHETHAQDFEGTAAKARNAVRTLGGDELRNVLDETGLGDHPVFFKFFAKLGDLLSNDQALSQKLGAEGFTPGEQTAKIEISKKMADSVFMKQYTSPEDPGHKAATAIMADLYKKAYPGNVTAQ